MEGFFANWRLLATLAAVILIATVFRSGRQDSGRPDDMIFFAAIFAGVLLLGFFFLGHRI